MMRPSVGQDLFGSSLIDNSKLETDSKYLSDAICPMTETETELSLSLRDRAVEI